MTATDTSGGAIPPRAVTRVAWRPRRRAVAVVAAAVLAVLAGLPALLARLAPARPTVETVAVARRDVVATVTATATLRPLHQVEVGSQVSGTLTEVKVDFNSTVRAGQVLAVIDPASFRARVLQQRAAVSRAEAATRKTSRELARARDLFAEQLNSRAELDAAETAYDQAKADLEQAKAQLDAAEVDLAHTVIRSPIEGVVISRSIETGQTVAASLQAPKLFVIARDLKHMRLETSVDEADVGSVKPGLTATFTVDAYPSRSFTGCVAQVRLEPTSSAGVVSYTTILETENPDFALMPGMTADVTIELGRRDGVLAVPDAALRFRPPTMPAAPAGATAGAAAGSAAAGTSARVTGAAATTDTAYVDRGGLPQAVPVTLGLGDGDYTEVIRGDLREGDRLITSLTLSGGAKANASSGGLMNLFRPPGPRGGKRR